MTASAHEDADPILTPAQRRLAASRAALAEIFAPPDPEAFPRSETMRFLVGGKGRLVALGLFMGLLLVKPKLAAGLARFLPLGQVLPIARVLLKALR
ncbi:MAG: hypothetical protein FJ171_11700 [Gammaproteobacteria bacterium]|nr:hypothetical protein [Gammaproteobacteria bacterium]